MQDVYSQGRAAVSAVTECVYTNDKQEEITGAGVVLGTR